MMPLEKSLITKKNGDKISKYGRAFLLGKIGQPNFPPILHVQGTPYEMGYQHGILLTDRITRFYSEYCSPIFFMMGGWKPGNGDPTREQLQVGRSALINASRQYFLPAIKAQAPEYYEEMQGMADALKDSRSPVTFEDLLVMACSAELTSTPGLFLQGCSDFAAWGQATADGKLIHGSNMDNEDFACLHRNIIVMIARPEKGHAFLGIIMPGVPWPLRGMNDAGVTVGEPTSESIDQGVSREDVPEIPHFMHMRRVIQCAGNTGEAIKIMENSGGTIGWNIFTTDNKPTAADIEVSWTKTGIVNPMEGVDALWSTNHSNAYPGWQGYPQDGPNLVRGQMAYWGVPWENVDTIEKWQQWVKENRSGRGGTYSRYEKFRDYYEKYQGKINVRKMMDIMSDGVVSFAGEAIPLTSGPVEHLYGIWRPIVSQELAGIYSCVFDPSDETAWIAAGAIPAQAGKYWPVNLKDQLLMMDKRMR